MEENNEITQDINSDELWDAIGFHKSVAGFWTNIGFTLIGILISSIVFGKLTSFFYPWPESLGYKDIAFGFLYLVGKGIFFPLYNNYGFAAALIPSIALIAFIIFFVYFPLTGYFGGWDKTNLDEFNKAAKMSGFSKFLVIPLAKLTTKACKISPFHDKFGIPTDMVLQDAAELYSKKLEERDKLRSELN